MFNDRRRRVVDIKLTKKQREYFDSAKTLSVDPDNHADFLRSLDSLKQQTGDKAVENLELTARREITKANPDPCYICQGAGCSSCLGTGRWLNSA